MSAERCQRTTTTLFFGVGTGRCGTMTLANALSAEVGVTCTHEGKLRDYETPRDQLLPFMTLENRLAYERPEDAEDLWTRARGDFAAVAARLDGTHFGDIAYNYAPFVAQIGAHLPEARLLVFFRNGIDFVRSATQAVGEDSAPVGWPPLGKALSAVERYVGLGRLAPRGNDILAPRWGLLDHVARNAWLWAETNRLILDGVAGRPPETTLVVRYEDFFSNPIASYRSLREFLGIRGEPTSQALERLSRPINRRADKIIGPHASWTEEQRSAFRDLAGPTMQRLGYALPPP